MPNPNTNRRAGKRAGINLGPNPLAGPPYDNMELYLVGAAVDTLRLGWSWGGPWAADDNFIDVLAFDTMESYSTGLSVNGLSGGTDFTTAYVDRQNYLDMLASDTSESYSDGTALSGLTGGTGVWAAAYVDR